MNLSVTKKNAKRILIIGSAHPYRGGITAFNERLANQFQQEGYEADIMTFTLQYPSFLFPGKTQYTSEPIPENLKIERRVNTVNPFNWLRTGKIIRKRKYDIVIFAYWMSFFAPCYGTIARRLKKDAVCIGLVHNMLPHEPSIIDKLLSPFFVRSMDGFVVLSESVQRDVERFDKLGKPKPFCPHPIYDHYGMRESRERALERLGLDKSYRYLLFFGLIRAYKGLDWLIEAFADERLRRYPVKLIIAGEFYENKKPYLDSIVSHHLSDKVIVSDEFIPESKVKDYFNACDLLVQPYKTATQSGVTQIAYHFEKPMVVTDVGALAEFVPDGKAGYVVHPDVKSIADALVDFYANNRQDDFKENILKEKAKYSWARMSSTLQSLFNVEKSKR